MISTAALTGSHLRTYQTIFRHPVSHNLGWHEVHALLHQLGEVKEEPNGNHRVSRNGHNLVLHPSRTKDVGTTEELLTLRRFLEQSEAASVESPAPEAHWLLVIDHREARIFGTEITGGVPQRILPPSPADHFRHAPHSKEFTRGQEKPDPNSFFEPVANALQAARQILIFGTGTGMGSEMTQFVDWAKTHRPEMAARIVGAVVVDEHHLSEGQLLAKARECYANLPKKKSENISGTRAS